MMPKKVIPMGRDMDGGDGMGGDESEGQMGDTGTTVVNMQDYPDVDFQQGEEVAGNFTGIVDSVSGGMATIRYDELTLEGANMATRELTKLTGRRPGRPTPQE